jgi:hypothetical protein
MAKSPAVALIISSMKKGKGAEKHSEPKSEDNAGELTAAEELLESIEQKDPEAMRVALKSFINICKEDY